jgi:hypothetical protein
VTLSLQNLERSGRVMRRDGLIYLVGDPPGEDDEEIEDLRAIGAAG